jgi:hypothetical protein
MVVKCIDEARLDEDGVLHDKIQMYYAGIHLATMTMAVVIDRSPNPDAAGAD